MVDCSNLFFSYKGEKPARPPKRFILPDGYSRYSHDCTIEELNLCGYVGPFEIPEVSEDCTLEWCAEECCFDIRELTEEEKKSVSEDIAVRVWISEELNEKSEIKGEDISLLSEYYIAEVFKYYTKLETLLKSTDRIAYVNLPSKPKSDYKYQEDFCKAFNEHFNPKLLSDIKEQYEKYGIINDVSPVFQKFFRVDSSWIKGTEPLPDWFELH